MASARGISSASGLIPKRIQFTTQQFISHMIDEDTSLDDSITTNASKEGTGETALLTEEEQMAKFEEALKESDWGHQPC